MDKNGNEDTLGYDSLIFTTGAAPFIPPINETWEPMVLAAEMVIRKLR